MFWRRSGSLLLGDVILLKSSIKTALCGVVTALSVVCMMLTSFVPIATYSCAMLAGLCVIIVVIELNPKWAFCVYIAVSLLSALIVTDKEAVVYYVVIFGYYPILKLLIEKKKSYAVQWILKLITFNAAAVVGFLFTVYVLGVPKESFSVGGMYLPWVFLLMGNVIFVLYDIAINGLVAVYIKKFRRYFKKYLNIR